MSDLTRSGPGAGPGGVPAAIGLSPILSARYGSAELARIRDAAPGSRLVTISLEGLADGPLDDVEVMLRGPLPAVVFDRLVARCPQLRWVHSASAGVERVLTPSARARDLLITNARGVFSRPIAEYVMLMVLAVSRRLPQLLELQRERTWQPLPAVELRDVTIGIIGLGSIGQAVASLATAFGCRVVAIRRHAATADLEAPPTDSDEAGERAPAAPRIDLLLPPEGLPRLLAESDFLVLALPLTAETADLLDEQTLALVKPGAWIINIARGGLIDERALVRALRDGPLGGAVLDAFRDEPLAPDSPLYGLPNCIVTPHTSWSSGRVLERTVDLFCDNLRRYRTGAPLRNVVDPAVGY
ncbi:MAG: D-2-hydroxyacid dehydrogenase [Candidatus Limnocylindrales bacterium]